VLKYFERDILWLQSSDTLEKLPGPFFCGHFRYRRRTQTERRSQLHDEHIQVLFEPEPKPSELLA
jgi:hypothetical protein